MAPSFQQPLVGQRLRGLRERAQLNRAQLAAGTGVSPSSLARLESGDDVRLSTYLRVTHYFLERTPQAWLLAQRLAALDDARRAALMRQLTWPSGDGHG